MIISRELPYQHMPVLTKPCCFFHQLGQQLVSRSINTVRPEAKPKATSEATEVEEEEKGEKGSSLFLHSLTVTQLLAEYVAAS